MMRSQTREYRRNYESQFYGIFKHGHRGTEHNILERTCKDCIDYPTCMRLERGSKIGCECKLKKGEPLVKLLDVHNPSFCD